MITVKNNVFHLATNNTSYIFMINELGLPEHLHYGHRLTGPETYSLPLRMKRLVPRSGEVSFNDRNWEINLNDLPLEFSTQGSGDFRTPFISMLASRNCSAGLDLRYFSNETYKGIKRAASPIVQALGGEDDAHGIRVDFCDSRRGITLSLYYTVFPSCDTIVRRAVITNSSKEEIALQKAASLQLDLFTCDYEVSLFGGPYGRENRQRKEKLTAGMSIVNESRSGFTGQKSNCIILENSRGCIITSLLYSGDHSEIIEVSPYGKTHIVTGLNSDTVRPVLKSGESFETPEAVLTYGTDRQKAVEMLHAFEENHIIRGTWKNRLRPVSFSTEFSMGLDVREDRLLEEIKNAAALGFEMFILSDGWFGVRSSDEDSLGDWSANTMKIPDGLAAISKACHKAGMLFGLWMSPELASLNSRYAMETPDWLVRDPRKKNNANEKGGYLIDLTRKEVYDDIFSSLKSLIERTGIDLIRWNLGTQMADVWSRCEDESMSGTWRHRYILAFNRLQRSIMLAFPNLLIENVSSTSPRFDMSLLASSSLLSSTAVNDSFEMLDAIIGSSSIVPLSCVSNTVTERRWNLEGRYSSLSSAFNIAAFGSLCYSIELKKLSSREKMMLKDQIDFYKMHRAVFQYGTFRVMENGNRVIMYCASPDRSTILLLLAYRSMVPSGEDDIIFIPDADERGIYEVARRSERSEFTSVEDYFQPPEFEDEAYTVSGDILKWAGLRLCEHYMGTSYTHGMRVMGDHSTRLYIFKKINEEK